MGKFDKARDETKQSPIGRRNAESREFFPDQLVNSIP